MSSCLTTSVGRNNAPVVLSRYHTVEQALANRHFGPKGRWHAVDQGDGTVRMFFTPAEEIQQITVTIGLQEDVNKLLNEFP